MRQSIKGNFVLGQSIIQPAIEEELYVETIEEAPRATIICDFNVTDNYFDKDPRTSLL